MMRLQGGGIEVDLDLPHLAAERQAFSALFGTADKAEGIASFKERRPPVWTGH